MHCSFPQAQHFPKLGRHDSIAPSSNNMAPATTGRSRRRQTQKSQPGLSTTFARISKNTVTTKSEEQKKVVAKQLALEKLDQQEQQTPSTPQQVAAPAKNKRKRAESDSTDEEEHNDTSAKLIKKTRFQLPTPPPSTPERATSEPTVPAAVAELVQIYSTFLKAFSLHRAHNGASAPAELSQFLDSVTRLHRKRIVSVVDVQRMLGLMEIVTELGPRKTVRHVKSPFRLIVSGIGTSRRQLIEYLGYEKQSRKNGRIITQRVSDFNDQDLQALYEANVTRVSSSRQLSGAVEDFPQLEFAIGAQTAVIQNKASETRKLILGGRKPDLDFGKLSVKDKDEPEPVKHTVKSRTLSLFERVKTKQQANAAVKTLDAQGVRRKHAIGRVGEVVEILRMKQQQKLRGLSRGRKVSFALQEIVGELNASLGVPMGDDEIKLCLEILAGGVSGGWCTIFELGATRSLVLTGAGKSGAEIAALLREG